MPPLLGEVTGSAAVRSIAWIAAIIEVSYRPIGAAIVGWVLAVIVLREILALPDLPGWFMTIGLLGGMPAFICSWVTLKTNKKESVHAGAEGPVRSIMLLSGGVVLPTANEQRRQAK
jgi:hypothetical protein